MVGSWQAFAKRFFKKKNQKYSLNAKISNVKEENRKTNGRQLASICQKFY